MYACACVCRDVERVCQYVCAGEGVYTCEIGQVNMCVDVCDYA